MEERTNGGRRLTRRQNPYQQWQEAEGLPVHHGSAADLRRVEVAPWVRTGQRGAFVSLGDQERGDGYVLEVAPGGQTEVQHHMFEATLYVVEGRGATVFWQGDGPRQTVEWQGGSVFSPPLNCFYQHFNLDGQAAARLFALTNAPAVFNLYRSEHYVFNDAYVFKDRYNAEDDYFSDSGEHLGWRRWKTNFIPDIRTFKLDDYKERGAGGTNMHFTLSNNTMSGHVSEFPPGTYKKGHRHGHGPHLIIVGGEGFSLFWNRGEEQRRKVDWSDGVVVVPQAMEYHQHFNTGPTPARYLVFGVGGGGRTRDEEHDLAPSTISEREGGTQIEYEDEDPAIYDLFVTECAKHGATVVLPRPNYAVYA